VTVKTMIEEVALKLGANGEGRHHAVHAYGKPLS